MNEKAKLENLDYVYRELTQNPARVDEKWQKSFAKDPGRREDCEDLHETLRHYRELDQHTEPHPFPEARRQMIMRAARLEAARLRERQGIFYRLIDFLSSPLLSPRFAYSLALVFVAGFSFWIGRGHLNQRLGAPEATQEVARAQMAVPATAPVVEPENARVAAKAGASAFYNATPRSSRRAEKASVDSVYFSPAAATPITASKSAPAENLPQEPAVLARAEHSEVIELPLRTVSGASRENRQAKMVAADSLSVQEQLRAAAESRKQQNYTVAMSHYRNVASLAPGSYESMYADHQRAQVLTLAGQIDDAITSYERIINYSPAYRHMDQVLAEAGKLYARSRNWEKARETLERCYGQFPQTCASALPLLQQVRALALESNQAETPAAGNR